MAVNTPNIAYTEMQEKGSWELLQTVLGGTPAIRKKGKAYLPQEPDEKDPNYQVRLSRSFLYNGFADTIEKCVSRPFSKPMTIELPDILKPLIENMDGEGQHIQDFCMEYFRKLVTWGIAHAYADYPTVEDPSKENKKTVKEKGLIPFNRIINAPALIGWKEVEKRGNERVLSEFRQSQIITVDKDDWEQENIEQIRLTTGDKFEVYRKNDKDEWIIQEDLSGTISKKFEGIPLATAYTNKKKMMVSLPPLLELLWTNLEHYQSLSDQKNILRFCRFGILMAAGFTADEIKKGITVSPTQVVYSENPEADLKHVEHTGKAVESGVEDIRSIESRMEVLGQQPMLQKYWNVKATGQAINESKSVSQIESWIATTIRAIKELLVFDAAWMGQTITRNDIKLEISKDFVFGLTDSKDLPTLTKAREMGDIPQKIYVQELQRFGVISDDVNVDDLIALVNSNIPTPTGFENFFAQGGTPGTTPEGDIG